MIGLLIALELGALLFAAWDINSRSVYIYTLLQVVDIVVVIVILYGRDNSSYKLSWVIVILLLPPAGVVLYFLTGTHHYSAGMRRRLRESRSFNRHLRHQDPRVLDALRRENEACARQSYYILNNTDKPVYRGTQVRFFSPGEAFFAAILEELRKAERFILLEFFIVAEGEMWEEIFGILREKVKNGVEVRLLYDDIGSMDYLQRGFKQKVMDAGIHVAVFNPFKPVLNKFMNYRDHRKITVIDGNVGYTGGINIGDEYINRKRPHGYWKDAGVLLTGEAVWNLTVMFLDMWQIVTGESLRYDRYCTTLRADADGFVQPFEDSPLDYYNVAEGAYMHMINMAKRYVYIMTPYLVLDNEMTLALCDAAKSGVDVRIITPHIPDKWYVQKVTQSGYRQLMEYGVKIYEYLPGFIHSKTVLSDDEVGMVGTVNMDFRSFYLQFECAVWICRNSVLNEIKEDFLSTFRSSRLIDPREWAKRPLPSRFLEVVLRLFAPLL